MSFTIQVEPIDEWPDKNTKSREGIRFKASYSDTLKVLNRELDALGTKGAVAIQIVSAHGGEDVRRDGHLRAGAKIIHPGVRLSFACRYGQLTYATDRYAGRFSSDMPDWQANLRAIALGLEALRTVDRYGITKSGEQYAGWRAIEGAGVDAEACWKILADYADQPIMVAKINPDAALRSARKYTHPDVNGGSQVRWNEVEAAAKVLGLL